VVPNDAGTCTGTDLCATGFYCSNSECLSAGTVVCPDTTTTPSCSQVCNQANGQCYVPSLGLNDRVVLTCTDQSFVTDAGLCTKAVSLASITPVVTDDDCSADFITTSDLSNGGVFAKGDTTVQWETDDEGVKVQCTQTVTVVDNQQPTFAPFESAITVTATTGCNFDLDSGKAQLPTGSDNCDFTLSSSPALPQQLYIGSVTPFLWTLNDGSTSPVTVTQTVTAIDGVSPQLTCKPAVTVLADSTCSYSLASDAFKPDLVDTCKELVELTTSSDKVSSLGPNTITWTATDTTPDSATCTQVVTLKDEQTPTISCPADIVQNSDSNQCGATVSLGSPDARDNCGAVTVTDNVPANSFFPLGTTCVKYTVTDSSGNTNFCVQTVTVNDVGPFLTVTGPTPNRLWPPNHELTPVQLQYTLADNCAFTPEVASSTVTVTNSETDHYPGQDLSGDIRFGSSSANPSLVITPELTASAANSYTASVTIDLRAERLGESTGRFYNFVIAGTDGRGNVQASAAVVVPHDASGRS